MAELTFADLWEILNYDFETGKLFWRYRERSKCKTNAAWMSFNNRFANKEAFTFSHPINKYKTGYVLNKSHKAHHIIWCMCYNYWPIKQIDHIDGDRTNNRLTNLREVTHEENMKNKTNYSSSKSGVHGVTFNRVHQKWWVRANINNKRMHLGYYDDFDEAVRVRKAAELQYDYHPNHGRPK